MAYCTLISPTTPSRSAKARVWRRISSTCASVIRYGGSTQAESPEWMPASSMCCITPPMTQRVPSAMASTSASKASSRKLVDQHRVLRRHPRRPLEVAPERGLVVDDLHRPAAQHVARAAPAPGSRPGSATATASSTECAMPLGGCATPSSRASASKRPRSSAGRSRPARCRGSARPRRSSARASRSGVCPPSCTTTPERLLHAGRSRARPRA